MGGKREDEQGACKSLVGGGTLAAEILALTRRAVKGFAAAKLACPHRRRALKPRVRAAAGAGVVELADTPDLGSGGASRGGSSPFARTTARAPTGDGNELGWNINGIG